MGRCNNRRAQQAAQELRNTPSRARFSSGPPNKRKGGRGGNNKGGGRGRGGPTDNNAATTTSGRGGAKAAVVEKLSKRVQQQSTTTTASLTKITRRRHPLANIDVSKLDELVLPEESLQEVMKILSDLNVKVVESVTQKSNSNSSKPPIMTNENLNNDEGDDDDDAGTLLVQTSTKRQKGRGTGYSEYEDDNDEDLLDGAYYTPRVPSDQDDANDYDWQDNDDDDQNLIEESPEESTTTTTTAELLRAQAHLEAKFRSDPVFVHLTCRLSLSDVTAFRACQAIEDMMVPNSSNNNDNDEDPGQIKNNPQPTKQNKASSVDKMGLAMDWLCLHLAEDELTAGFKPNPTMTSPIILMGTGRTKPIPHPSISLAPKITTDRDWKQSILIQERVMKFLPLGFQHGETYDVFKEHSVERLEQESSLAALEDDEALRVLLKGLDQETLKQDETATATNHNNSKREQQHTQGDLEYAASEREEEEQALAAIYDDDFTMMRDKNSPPFAGHYRYKVTITPSEPLKEPARSENCSLYVFVRPGYPAFEPPLMLFHNPTLPPTLLRRINMELIRHVNQSLGAPAVFEVVNYLSTEIVALQEDFMKEQRSKELEAQQLRLRREAGHVIGDDEYDIEAKLGRRQRAKLKAAAKAYDQPELAKQAELERQQRQMARIERAQAENRNVRQSMAERAIEQREKERQQEEMNAVYRAAMSRSLNSGDSVETARSVAENAKLNYMREHGLLDDDNGQEAAEETPANSHDKEGDEGGEDGKRSDSQDEDQKENIPYSTPTTAAFMERLREMYAAAAKEKAEGKDTSTRRSKGRRKQEQDLDAYHLNPPRQETKPDPDELDDNVRYPRPVAVPVGELARVMEDVIATQKEQPWLVASEARAPETSLGGYNQDDQAKQKCRDISRKLKEENEIKFRSVEELRTRNNGKKTPNNCQKGFTPERFDRMLSQRERLPAYSIRDKIVSVIASNQVTVVAGDTGSGKTTQVPQLVLDELINNNRGAEANIIVTQPRRISAIGVSERIADERCERVGETCGYSIMLERKSSRKTRLLLCTTGILLRRLQCDPDLAAVSHVFVDEVHERDLNTDFLLIILRELLQRRKSLKLVLMSATLNAEAFSDYFGGCAIISIPGRAHPVKEYRLEDVLQLTGYEVQEGSDYALKDSDQRKFSKSALRKMYYPRYDSQVIHSLSIVNENVINYELLAALLEKICENEDEGAILVFMPGMMEITKAIEEMRKKELFQSPAVRILPLHSTLSTSDQTAVFEVPEKGVKKIVVGTNIAETSITIEDVVYVVDCGRVKENRKDEINETPTLVECWVSRASAKQRRGRAGRVRPGIAYHLFSSHTYEHELQEYQLPEMLRVGLEDLVLQILILDLGEPSSFLGRALNPPSETSMRNSLKLLEELGAVECHWKQEEDTTFKIEEPKETAEDEDQGDLLTKSCNDLDVNSELTALGFHLATLPVDPRVGKMMIYGALFGCIDPALTIAASMSVRNPFVSPFDKRDEADAARRQFAIDGSDHLAILGAFTQWKEKRRQKGDRAAQNFIRENYLSRQSLFQMEDLRRQFANLLVSIGFLPSNFRLQGDSPGKGNSRGDNGNSTSVQNHDDDANTDDAISDINADNMALVKAVLCAGLYPNIIVAPTSLIKSGNFRTTSAGDKQAGEVPFQSLNKGDVYLHPCTIAFKVKHLESRYCCYHEMVKTSKTYVRDITTVSTFALVLFGGTLKVYQDKGVVTVDEWLKFRCGRRPATLFKHLRAEMERMLLKKIVTPEEHVTGSPIGKALIQSISTLLRREKDENMSAVRTDGAEIVRPWRGSEDQQDQQQRSRGGRGGGRGRGRGRGGRGRGRGLGRSS